MEELKNSVRAVCYVSAAVCIIRSLTGGTKLHTVMDMLMKLIMAAVIAAPFVNRGFSSELPDISGYGSDIAYDGEEIYMNAMRMQTAENVREILVEQLSAAGISVSEIEVDVNISPDGCIDIYRVTVTADDPEAAAGLIRESLGEETEVIDGGA